MKKFIFTLIMLLCLSSNVYAATTPIEFSKVGGGQWIYCNNPEFLTEKDVSTDENPSPKYLMKNEGLEPDRYQVFFCFYNNTDFDMEPDIEFLADGDTVIKINSIGYYIPFEQEFFDCIPAWSDYLGLKIRTISGLAQAIPYTGNKKIPAQITMHGGRKWISNYIYNYDVVPPHVTFNMLVDFEIVSGKADVNFTALKSYKTGDRSHHVDGAPAIGYVNDTSVKGIEPDSLPIVQANLDMQITKDTKDGDRQSFMLKNPLYPNGVEVDEWVTNINLYRDTSHYCNTHAVDSDMLTLQLADDNKLNGYGKFAKNKSNIWYFDTHHYNTTEFETYMPWQKDYFVPNDEIIENETTNSKWHFNLGNFGVTNRYYMTIQNLDFEPRTANFMIDASLSSNIAVVKDIKGNILNPYTLEPENPYALCKGINYTKKPDCLFSAEIPAGATKTYILDIILPTNCYGGMTSYIVFDSKKYLETPTLVEDPVYDEYNNFQKTFFNGKEFMTWKSGSLYTTHGEVTLPESAIKALGNRNEEFKFVKTKFGYVGRFAGWDRYPWEVSDRNSENKLYIFGPDFEFKTTVDFDYYIEKLTYSDEKVYILCHDEIYSSADGLNYEKEPDLYAFPAQTENGTIFNILGKYEVSNGFTHSNIKFEGYQPNEIKSSGGLYYAICSLKNFDTDFSTANIISVSADGVNWHDVWLPNRTLYVKDVQYKDDTLYVYGKYETLKYKNVIPNDEIRVKIGNDYLAYDTSARVVNDRTMIPLRFTFEKFGQKVDWLQETKEIIVNDGEIKMQIASPTAYVKGEPVTLDSPPFVERDRTLIPLRFVSENLGYIVDWNQKEKTALVATPSPSPTPLATATPKPSPTPKVRATATPKPRATVKPSATPVPTKK